MAASQPIPAEKREQLARLEDEARKALKQAYAPYSRFEVGAALLTREGLVFSGCNIENASYGHTICAERTAVFKAVSEGHHHFSAIVIVTSSPAPVAPCGACRQVLWEFSPELVVVMAGESDRIMVPLADLLPHAFGPRDLGK